MNHNLGKVQFHEKEINLDKTSKKCLKDMLKKIDEEEIAVKQELDDILEKLV